MATPQPHTDHDPLALVFAADEGFALPLGVALYSALCNLEAGRTIFVYVLDGGIEAESRERLRRVASGFDHVTVRLEIRTLDTSAFSDLQANLPWHFSPAMFLDLKIPEVVDERFEKALFVDPDVLVMESLAELWKEDVSGVALSAVKVRVVSHPRYGIARWKELGLDADAPYFSAGVYVMNLEYWRKENVGPRVLSYLRAHDDEEINRFGDQEPLNAVLAGEWKEMDPAWNVNLHVVMDECRFERAKWEEGIPGNREELLRAPCLIHYTARTKPWVPESTCPPSFRNMFYSHLRESSWFAPEEYVWWRAKVPLRRFWWWIRENTRSFRKKIGLMRR